MLAVKNGAVTHIRFVQIRSIFRRQSKSDSKLSFIEEKWKTLCVKEMMFTSNFSYLHNVFKSHFYSTSLKSLKIDEKVY